MKEALLYEKKENNSVHCFLCGHHCKINEGNFGFCGARQNIAGSLFSHVYGRPIAMQVDPVEKKPLYHFLPGTNTFSIATLGCNFRCGFCQNWEISQKSSSDILLESGSREVLPQEIVDEALRNGCKSISYTYTEPTIFFEYAFETAKLAKAKGLYNIFVTNGYMTKECLEMISPYLDAANVDLKFFSDKSYTKICSARLEPVLSSIKLMHTLGIWVEVTTLVIPEENDSDKELDGIARFIYSVDKNIPWHISRFHPDYHFDKYPATAKDALMKAQRLGVEAGLSYIYLGNVSGKDGDTLCPECKKKLIKRDGFMISDYNIKCKECIFCGANIPGVFE